MNAKVQCKMFSSSTRKWDELVAEASEFASGLGKDRLINMSVSASGGTDWFGLAVGGISTLATSFGLPLLSALPSLGLTKTFCIRGSVIGSLGCWGGCWLPLLRVAQHHRRGVRSSPTLWPASSIIRNGIIADSE